ncbi:MAG TPA: 5-bromo-4-chloroindolyl phosphate hydrolysis family protein [Candidatus Nitrosocosmicus sp.]|nr:5-bromo-4-chloroindolyl phosphate hydrolysis family protein [Candidatus Nitrosocosmicus sp.]
MGRRRYENGQWEFDEDKGSNCCNGHRGTGSLIGLIFGIVSFSITLAFRIVGAVFQVLFGVLSRISSGTKNAGAERKARESSTTCKQNASYTIKDMDKGAAAQQKADNSKEDLRSNVREFKKQEQSKAQAEAATTENKTKEADTHNKDIYVVLFILTIIPATVALAMGKLLYAGAIGAAGFGLMLVAGAVSGIAGSIRKKSEEQKAEEAEEEPEETDSVEKLIKDAFEKLFEIRKDIDKVKDVGIRARMEAICCTGEKIIGEVRTNPESLVQVRKFFYYYLDAFGEIVKKYLRLSNFEEASEEVSRLVAETEKAFLDIDRIFRELCEKLLEKDMMHLKAEINVIKNSN